MVLVLLLVVVVVVDGGVAQEGPVHTRPQWAVPCHTVQSISNEVSNFIVFHCEVSQQVYNIFSVTVYHIFTYLGHQTEVRENITVLLYFTIKDFTGIIFICRITLN